MSGLLNAVVLKLYIAGQTARSERAVSQARRLCEREFESRCELVIVDILEEPALAEQARILATPTLMKEGPQPARRVIGDLSDIDRVILALGLTPAPAHAAARDPK